MKHIEEILTTFLNKMKNREINKYRDAVAKATEELLKNSDKTSAIVEAIIPMTIGNVALLSQFINEDYFEKLVNELPQDILDHVSDVNDALTKLDSNKIN